MDYMQLLSKGSLSKLISDGKLEGPITLQVMARSRHGKVTEVELSDSEISMTAELNPDHKFTNAEMRYLKPYNVVDVLSIEKNETGVWVLMSYNNGRVCDRSYGKPKETAPRKVSKSASASKAGPSKSSPHPEPVEEEFDPEFVTIKNITAMTGDESVRGKVVQVTKLRTYTSQYGPGNVFNFILGDEKSTIQVTAWNDLAIKYASIIKAGQGLLLTNFRIKQVQTGRPNPTKHSYCLEIQYDTVVKFDVKADLIKLPEVCYTSILDIINLKDGEQTNIHGIVYHVGTRENRRVNERDRTILRVSVVDASMHVVEVTLWDDLTDFTVGVGKSVAMHSLLASRYQGFGLSSFVQSEVIESQNTKLEKWWEKTGKNMKTFFVKSLFDKRACSNAFTCFDIICEKSASRKKPVQNLSGVYRVMQYENFRPFIKCPECLISIQSGFTKQSRVSCSKCKKSWPVTKYDYVVNLFLGDHTGHFSVAIYNSVLNDILTHGSTVISNTQQFGRAFQSIRYKYFLVYVKMDKAKDNKVRLTATEMNPWDNALLPLYYGEICKREVDATRQRAQAYEFYWNSSPGYCVLPVMFSDVYNDRDQKFLNTVAYKMLSFVAKFEGVDMRDGTTFLTFEWNNMDITLEKPAVLTNFDEDDDIGKLVEVLIEKNLDEDNKYALFLRSIAVLPDDAADKYDHNRKLMSDVVNTMKHVYRQYVFNAECDDDFDSNIDQTLSPQFDKSVSMSDEPPAKKYKK